MSSSTVPPGPAQHDPIPTGVRVLVVEDDPPIAQLVARYLENDGFVVDVAADGETGVKLARSWRPDVVVLDLMLPGMDGIEVCRQLRTFSDASHSKLLAELPKMVDGIAAAHGVTAHYALLEQYPVTVNDPEHADMVAETATRLFGADRHLRWKSLTPSV